jgi:hypothetical protein
MELVEGDALSQRIAKGAIPLDEALPKRPTSTGSSLGVLQDDSRHFTTQAGGLFR